MALPQKNSSLEQYYEASIYLTSSLQLEPSTASLADPLVQLEQENRSLREQLESTRTEQIRAYVRVVQADRKVDDCIRDLSNAAKSVLDEASKGNPVLAAERLKQLESIPLLEIRPEVQEIASAIVGSGILPPKAEFDVLHLAVAAYHSVDYLLTWNCLQVQNHTG